MYYKAIVLCTSLIQIDSIGYRTACGSLNLKTYSTTFCNVTVTHEENAVGLVET